MASKASDQRIKPIDVVGLAALRFQRKLSFDDIAKITDIPKATAYKKIKDLEAIFNPEAIEAYERNKPEILSAVEKALVSDMLDPVRREKASLNNTAYAFQQIYQANRNSRGLAGSITEHRQAYDIEISMVDSEIKRLESRFSGKHDVIDVPLEGDNGT